jgi:hypothetical protein
MIKVQVFVNGAYAYRKTMSLTDDDELDRTQIHALLQQILRTIRPKAKYHVELKEDDS